MGPVRAKRIRQQNCAYPTTDSMLTSILDGDEIRMCVHPPAWYVSWASSVACPRKI
jgi:hypothetical protein